MLKISIRDNANHRSAVVEGKLFRASGVFTKHVIKRLAREIHRNNQEAKR